MGLLDWLKPKGSKRPPDRGSVPPAKPKKPKAPKGGR